MLNYISIFENVHMLLTIGFGIIAVVAMVLFAHRQDAKQKSADARWQVSQQIELAYANQLKLANETSDKKKKGRKTVDQWGNESYGE